MSADPIDVTAERWSAAWGDDAVSPMSAVSSLMRVQQIVLGRLNEQLERFDLTFQRYEVLMAVHLTNDEGAQSISAISTRLLIHRTSAGALVDGLERSGLVRREPHPTDRRSTLVAATGRGREVLTAATRELSQSRFGTTPLQRSELEAIVAMFRWVRLKAGDFAAAARD